MNKPFTVSAFPELPSEFDPNFYRHSHADLFSMSNMELYDHYLTHGIREGRVASPGAVRENFLKLIPSDEPVLEIGPFCNPCAVGDHVRYFDVLDKAGLIARADRLGIDHSRVRDIHFVSPTGDLSSVSDTFGSVLSSHCIEHQPDLINHLTQVARLLRPNGRYFLIIPDKRYCFDHFIAESTVADVIDAHLTQRIVHRPGSIIEHRALTTHNDSLRHWQGDHGSLTMLSKRVADALAEIRSSQGAYIDVHAWQFTPQSFRVIVDVTSHLEFTALRPLRIYETPFGRIEFCAILYKPSQESV